MTIDKVPNCVSKLKSRQLLANSPSNEVMNSKVQEMLCIKDKDAIERLLL